MRKAWRKRFQFLSRNSSRSRNVRMALQELYAGVSIPQSEFFSFTPTAARETTARLQVSIPQSEFFSFTQGNGAIFLRTKNGFNSSVGILLVHAYKATNCVIQFVGFNSSVGILLVHAFDASLRHGWNLRFQFLSRNSSRSRAEQRPGRPHGYRCFNSSVGILLVHARRQNVVAGWVENVSIPQSEFFSFTPTLMAFTYTGNLEFQFLSRNSSRSRKNLRYPRLLRRSVSIPQSEFFSFTQELIERYGPDSLPSFNSSVGILLVHACRSQRSRET